MLREIDQGINRIPLVIESSVGVCVGHIAQGCIIQALPMMLDRDLIFNMDVDLMTLPVEA